MLSDELHKNSLYKNETFPFTMFTVNRNDCIPPGPGYHYLHWHEALQFTLVTSGTVSMQVSGTHYELKAGDAIFINSGLLHMTSHISKSGEYVSFNFPTKLLSFFSGSQLELDYILPFTTNYCFPAQILTNNVLWQTHIIEKLWALRTLCLAEDTYAKNYEIAISLTEIWLLLIRSVKDSLIKASKNAIKKQENLQAMLAFIHSNYMKEVTLEDIAKTVHISNGECCRSFKNTIHMTPYDYLILFRLNKGADLLKETNYSVTTIAGMVGFNDVSHFIQSFKKKMKMTPTKYRKYFQ